MKNKIIKISYITSLAILIGVTAVYATSKLTPPETISNTMYSLNDIYELATNGTSATEGTGDIQTTPSTIEETGKTLKEVYDAVYLALNPPALVWQTDPALNLCWSNNQYEIDNGCTVGSGFTQTPDTLTTLGAVEYCQYLNENGTTLANTAQNIWHLPTRTEFISIIDDTKYNSATNVTGFAEDTSYWSSTGYAGDPNFAWLWNTYDGGNGYSDKNYQAPVRCVH